MTYEDVEVKRDQLIGSPDGAPHLLLLGAGASRAALPNGDKNGKHLPLMKDLALTLGLDAKLTLLGLTESIEEFESIYAIVSSTPQLATLKLEIEQRVLEYFSRLELPDEPTLYDHMLLCMRPFDVIATFNWDPFLMQAGRRVGRYCEIPHPIYLHGNVGIGYCDTPHERLAFGIAGEHCRHCGHPFTKSRLLFPVTKKNYQGDTFTKTNWRDFQTALQTCYLFTVFGYGAPKSDVEAKRLMKSAWGPVKKRNLEETEIIDIEPENLVHKKWRPFIHSHHYAIFPGFYDSLLATFPRRSSNAFFRLTMQCESVHSDNFPQNATWRELREWVMPYHLAETKVGL